MSSNLIARSILFQICDEYGVTCRSDAAGRSLWRWPISLLRYTGRN
ncbi:hypothetical protein [Maricaulis sp.]